MTVPWEVQSATDKMHVWMLGANHQAELRDPGGGADGRPGGTESHCNPLGKQHRLTRPHSAPRD